MNLRTLSTAFALATLAVACTSTGPTLEALVGGYEATEAVVDDDDLLAAGGALSLSLLADSTVTGELFVPETFGGPMTFELGGNWKIRDEVVGFVSSVPLIWTGNALVSHWTAGESSGSLVLRRQ